MFHFVSISPSAGRNCHVINVVDRTLFAIAICQQCHRQLCMRCVPCSSICLPSTANRSSLSMIYVFGRYQRHLTVYIHVCLREASVTPRNGPIQDLLVEDDGGLSHKHAIVQGERDPGTYRLPLWKMLKTSLKLSRRHE